MACGAIGVLAAKHLQNPQPRVDIHGPAAQNKRSPQLRFLQVLQRIYKRTKIGLVAQTINLSGAGLQQVQTLGTDSPIEKTAAKSSRNCCLVRNVFFNSLSSASGRSGCCVFCVHFACRWCLASCHMWGWGAQSIWFQSWSCFQRSPCRVSPRWARQTPC